MSKSYWRYCAAIAGLIFTASLGYGIYGVWEYEQQPYATEKYQPARDARFPVVAKKSKVATSPYQPKCEAPQTRDDADLCSQWEMVQSSEEGNRLVRIAISLASLEFIGLIISLGLSGWAAIAAIRGARASEQTITVTREMGYAQTRAYLSADYARMFTEFGGGVTIHITNIGATPSIWIEIESSASLIEPGITAFEVPIKPHGAVQRWPIDATGGRDIECAPDSGDVEFEGLIERGVKEQKYLVFQGVMRWETVFGEIFESTFFFWGMMKFRGMKEDADGNYSEIPIHLSRPCLPVQTYRKVKNATQPSNSTNDKKTNAATAACTIT